jgi:NAD(P)-dependent dehydrogenase (short-subunit alcohol dehydrogenase family)
MAMRSMSVDLKDSGILVMAMHPGGFEFCFLQIFFQV